jgi:ABC-type multidrug transport system fused ATPase/permease subunit
VHSVAGVGLVIPDTFCSTTRSSEHRVRVEAIRHRQSAARVANAHDFIAALPTARADRRLGLRLSGGQRQRLHRAPSLPRRAGPRARRGDERSTPSNAGREALIETRDRTVLLIAHRLSTVRDADEILVLDGGRIVERGDHPFARRVGAYSRLVGR